MSRRSGMAAIGVGICGLVLAIAGPSASAQTTPARSPQKAKVTLPTLAAQGFEVKAAFGSYLVVQRGKDVWLCYMLETHSDCEAAD